MPVANDSQYKTVSAVLTREQVRRLDHLRGLRSTHLREASFSEIVRVVIDAGLDRLSHAPLSSFATTSEEAESAA